MITRNDVAHQLARLYRGEISPEELRRWMTPALVAAEVPSPLKDRLLVTRIAFLLEDESLTEEEHRALAGRLWSALQSAVPNERVLAVVPLLVKAERLRNIVSALQTGRMSRTSFLSFLTESRLPEPLRTWLTRASVRRLQELTLALERGALEDVESLLSRAD